MSVSDVAVGETVERVIGDRVAMRLKVTAVTDARVVCGPWEFDRATGAEIDEDLGWGPDGTGSYIRRPAC